MFWPVIGAKAVIFLGGDGYSKSAASRVTEGDEFSRFLRTRRWDWCEAKTMCF